MKRKRYNYLLIATTVLLAACGQQENLQPDETDSGSHCALLVKEVRTETEAGVIGTRASAPLTSGSIGVFRAADAGASAAYPVACNNYKYTYNGGWQPDDAANTVYLTGKDIGVCAYYPYRADAAYADKLALPLTSGQYTGSGDVNDICYDTERMVNATSTGRSTTFTMKHAMALLEFVLYGDAGTSSLTVSNVTIEHTKLINTATLNITNGAYTTVTTTGTLSYNPSLTISGSTVTTSALLVPFDLGVLGLKVSFTATNINTSSVSIPVTLFGNRKLEAGKHYRIKIALNGMELGGVEIRDWRAIEVDNGGSPYPI